MNKSNIFHDSPKPGTSQDTADIKCIVCGESMRRTGLSA